MLQDIVDYEEFKLETKQVTRNKSPSLNMPSDDNTRNRSQSASNSLRSSSSFRTGGSHSPQLTRFEL